MLGLVSLAAAQQPTATITALTGSAAMSVQGKQAEAKIGMVLRQGDTLQTQAGATATLTLSDGSVINLGENTNMNIDELWQSPEGARKSRLKVLWGKIRMFLSPGHQKEGSAFVTETPNAQVGVKFSQPSVEVTYEPETKTTIVRAYTVDVSVINLLTKAEVERMPRGHQAIIREDFILVTKIMDLASLMDQLRRTAQLEAALVKPAETIAEPTEDKMDLLLAVRGGGSTDTSGPATSQLPAPGDPTSSPGSGTESVGFTFTLTEE